MAVKAPPSIAVSAILQLGLPTAILPQRGYKRVITAVDLVNSVQCQATIYKGIPGGAFKRVSGISIGNNNTYNQNWQLASGQNAIVIWTVVGANVADAIATFTWVESS